MLVYHDSSPNHDHSLARRLGFCLNEEYYGFLVAAGLAGYFVNPKTGDKRVVMKPNEWENMLSEQKELFEVTRVRFDLDAVVQNKVQKESRRVYHYAIRIGMRNDESHNSVVDQMKAKAAPPQLLGLLSMQRSLCRNVKRMTYDVLVEDQDLFDALAIEYEINKNRRAREDAEAQLEAKAASLGKRQRASSSSSSSSSSTTNNGFRNKDGVFGAEEVARLVKSLSLAERDILLTEIVVENTSKEKVLEFRNLRNNSKESYIRVPSNTTDQSFTRHIAWFDSAIKVNAGKAGTQYKSAKRMTKHLFNKYKDASMDALKEMKLMPPGKMNEVQMAAMYTAGGISSDHYIVPLLQCLIGIGDDILRKFREEVSEKIEYLTPEEIATRSHLAELEVKQAEARQECKDFGSSDEGNQLDSLVGKLKRAKTSLAKIEGFTNTPGATAVSVKDDSPVDLFLQEVMNFIEYGDNDDADGLEGTIDTPDDNDATDENGAQVTSTQKVAAADSSAPGENDIIREKIAEVKTDIYG